MMNGIFFCRSSLYAISRGSVARVVGKGKEKRAVRGRG